MIRKIKRFYTVDNADIPDNTPGADCFNYEITVLVPENIQFDYTDCAGTPQSLIITDTDGTVIVCASISPTTAATSNKYTIVIGDICT